MTYTVTNIKYAIGREDVECAFDYDDYANPSDYYKALDNEIAEIEESLPNELTISANDEEEIADKISDVTGWLVEGFEIKG